MKQVQTVHHLRPHNRKSYSKYSSINLGTITEQNGTNSAITSMENSTYRKIQHKSQRLNDDGFLATPNNPLNQSQIFYQNPISTSNMASQHSAMTSKQRTPLKQCRNCSPINSNIVVINNKRIITGNNHSRSKSPALHRISPSNSLTKVMPYAHSPVKGRMPMKVIQKTTRPVDSGKMLQNQHEKQLLVRKIQILQKRISELHKQKQSSVISLLKENHELKQELEKYKNGGVNDSKNTEILSHKMITLSQMGEIDNLREVNLKISKQLQQLRQKMESSNQWIKVPELIPLPLPLGSDQDISRVITQNLELSINSNPLQNIHNNSDYDGNQSSQYKQAQMILINLNRLNEENNGLKEQIKFKDVQMNEKDMKIIELEEYVKAINGYISQNATMLGTNSQQQIEQRRSVTDSGLRDQICFDEEADKLKS